MRRPRLAIVGTGIAGLGCAYLLRDRFDLSLFEQADYAGGHTNTIDVQHRGESVAFDTGFMVFNRVTYPFLCRLFEELKVPVKPTSMSFSVQHRPTGLEFCGSGWNTLFAQRRNLFRPRYWRLLQAIHRFNQEAVPALDDPNWAEVTLGDYVQTRGYGDDFLHQYLIPMSSAVWSTPPDQMLAFPATTLLRFFHNHGFLGLHTQHPWWTVDGGAREYVRRMWPLFGDRIRLKRKVRSVRRLARGAEVTTEDGSVESFDRVILASHADQSLRLLSEPDPLELRLLREFHYQPNRAVVHTDTSVMPRSRRAWASWNYRIDVGRETLPSTIYWMNCLQGVSDRTDYFVSINGADLIRPEQVLRTIDYEHPLFSLGAIQAQRELPRLNTRSPDQAIFFAGSYFRFGFHEDALGSAVACARAVAGEEVWPGA